MKPVLRLSAYAVVALPTLVFVAALCFEAAVSLDAAQAPAAEYLSPGALAVDARRDVAYTALTTAKGIAVTDLKTGQTERRIALPQNPHSVLLSPDGSTLYVGAGEARGAVYVVNPSNGKIKTSIAAGHTPQGLALTNEGKTLYVANRFSNTVAAINAKSGKLIAEIAASREPRQLCLTPDGKTLAVANFLPAQASVAPIVAAQITLIDPATNSVRANVTLPDGSQSVGGIAPSGDGKYIYAVHILSRYGVPITQLDRGWVNTGALSIIDLSGDSLYATVLLDDAAAGAANPAGICIAKDEKLCVALAGTHEIMTVDLKGLHAGLASPAAGNPTDTQPRDRRELSVSLTFASPYKKRIPISGLSPRAVTSGGNKIYVASRFSTILESLSLDDDSPPVAMSLGIEPAPDAIRRGELAFHDASLCYQQWQSCASCHPDGRIDGLNWDQQNDGLGNPKNTKSLLYSHLTPPSMITGIRESAELAVRKGILHTLETAQPEHIAADMDEYLKHLTPVESPYIEEYRTKDPRQKGKQLFDRSCLRCHDNDYFTDMRKYDVGTGTDSDLGRAFDTPSLRELWRTAPYLYDGRATTIEEVLTKYNPDDKHGATRGLSKEELEMLALYLKTL